MLARQELAHDLTDDRRAAKSAAGDDFEAGFAVRSSHDVHADVVHHRGGPVLRRAGNCNLELARQVGKFGVESRPLADDLAPRPRVLDLVRRHAREMIGSHVANAVAARLDRMHFDGRKIGEDVGHLIELGPVELDVLPRRDVPVARGHSGARCSRACAAVLMTTGRRELRRAASVRAAAGRGRCAGASA
jgi:hypothetical protein